MAQSNSNAADPRKLKPRRFYIMDAGSDTKMADFEIMNLDELLLGNAGALAPPQGRRGFPTYKEKPHLVIGIVGDKKRAIPPSDIEPYHAYWLISDQMKALFETIDPQAFAFQACDVTYSDGSQGPAYWLCDVIRVLEAFDASTVAKATGSFLGDTTLVFNETAIGNARIFRTRYSFLEVFCDQSLKDACKSAGIKGARFFPCFKR
jgi:hypothetical protein